MMSPLHQAVRHRPLVAFVVLAFAIALGPFLLAAAAGADPFTNPAWMPVLLLMIYSPTLASLVVHRCEGRARDAFVGFGRLPSGWAPWLIAAAPLALLVYVGVLVGAELPPALGPGTWVLLVGFQLILGPIGEEAGWRGLLLRRLLPRVGALRAALVVGVIWALWHAPLWFIASPQSAIPFPVFVATVVCFSVLMTAVWERSDGSLWPSVLFHLGANLGAALLEIGGVPAAETYVVALPAFALAASLVALMGGSCALPTAARHPLANGREL